MSPPEKIWRISGRNTASIGQRFLVFSWRIRWLSRISPVGSCGIRWPEYSTWLCTDRSSEDDQSYYFDNNTKGIRKSSGHI
jgi:hypothetical protein